MIRSRRQRTSRLASTTAWQSIRPSETTLRGKNDVDIYSVNFNAGEVITAEVFRASSSLRYSTIRVFRANGSQLTSDTSSGLQASPLVNHLKIPASGQYYIAVGAYNNSSYDPTTTADRSEGNFTGDYRLVLERLLRVSNSEGAA